MEKSDIPKKVHSFRYTSGGIRYTVKLCVPRTYKKRYFKETQRWINALRSGKYKQGIGALGKEVMRNDLYVKQFCCLGVLSKIQGRLKLTGDTYRDDHKFNQCVLSTYNTFAEITGTAGQFAKLDVLCIIVGRRDGQKISSSWQDSLAGINDAGVPFRIIANIIDVLFTSKKTKVIKGK